MKELTSEDFNQLIPVQIIGTQRSGSNLFRLMINQLKGVFAPHPPHILKTFAPIVDYYGDLSEKKNFYNLVSDICEFVDLNPVPWKNCILDPDVIIKYCAENTLLEAYRKIYEINAIGHGATFWFNKSMQNVYFIEQFEKTGFNPYYIHLIRDGRDVALSFKNAIVGEKHIYYLANKWKKDQDLSDFYFEKYAPGKSIRIRYEDLLIHADEEIKRVCHFLGIKYSDDIFKYYESEDSHLTADSGKMWRNLALPIIKNNFNKYKKGLSLDEIGIFENIAYKLLDNYGYELNRKHESTNNSFSNTELNDFEDRNTLLKKLAIENAVKSDLKKREGQRKLIQKIFTEKSIPVNQSVL